MRTVGSITLGAEVKLREDKKGKINLHAVTGSDTSKVGLLSQISPVVYDYISQHLQLESDSTQLISTNIRKDLYAINDVRRIVNLRQVNDVRYIHKFLVSVNEALPDAGIYVGCVETTSIRKMRLFKKNHSIWRKFVWLVLFIIHRAWPKIPYLRGLYFFLTQGRYRWLTEAEVLGRLVSCGFEIIEFKKMEGKVYFVVMKTKEPDRNIKPSYEPIFAMNRIGKNGKIIKVYKIRTMHPYAEYLQDYIIKLNGYNNVGKPAGDFRLTRWGQFFRRYWLDELPQLFNVLIGNMAIVGMRPLSQTRFNEMPEDVQKERIKYKPGCIPPYVALLMPDKDENIEADRIYMAEKEKHPIWTDIKYLFKAIYNILSGKIKSS